MYYIEVPFTDFHGKSHYRMRLLENQEYAALTINDKEVAVVIKKTGEYILYNPELITWIRVKPVCDFLLMNGVHSIDGGRILMESLFINAKDIRPCLCYGLDFLYDDGAEIDYELTH